MALTKKTAEVTSFKVANTEIILGQTYEVVPKFDADAPDGFQKFGTTKLLMEGIGESHGIPFDDSLEIWDTGFDLISLCNTEIPEAEKTSLVNIFKKQIKEKYEEQFKKDLSSADTENSFWKKYRFEVYNGKTFDTNNVKDLLDLYMALKHYKICEKGEKSYLARTAAYNVTNKEKVMSVADQRNENKAEAIFTYMNLNKGDKETLLTVLEWLQFTSVRTSDEKTLTRTMMAYLEKDPQHVDNFLEAYKKSQSEAGKEEMELFAMVMKLISKRKIAYKRKEYYLNDESIGNSPKDIAKRALSNPELMKNIAEAYETIQPALA